MSLPERPLRNGIILGYNVTYWSTDDLPRSIIVLRNANNFHTAGYITELRNFFYYNISIQAFTSIGLGPSSNVTVIKTDEDGKTQILLLMFFT